MEGERNFSVCFCIPQIIQRFRFQRCLFRVSLIDIPIVQCVFLDWPTKGHCFFLSKKVQIWWIWYLYLRDSYVNRGGVKNLFVLLKIFFLSFRDFNFPLWAVKPPPHPPFSSCLLVWIFQWKWIIPFTNQFSLFFSFFNQVNINSNKFVCDCFVLTAFKLTVVSKIKCLFQTRCYIYSFHLQINFLCFSPFSIRYTDSAVLLRSERLLNTL